MKQIKAIELLKDYRNIDFGCNMEGLHNELDEAIDELEQVLKEKDLLEEYVQFARLHIDTYRCSCGSLGRIGYRCSNKECNKY